MKSTLLLVLSFPACTVVLSQNLVPNGDLEQFTSCPTTEGELSLATPWVPPTTTGSSDYFNACMGPGGMMDVPNNNLGNQPAHSGSGYAGVFIYQDPFVDIREYLEVPLTSPLVAGACYTFSMYMALGDICQYTDDNIGVYFSGTLVSGVNNITVLPFVPQLNNATGNYPDPENWTLMTGDYIAQGGESHLLIGSFVTDAVAAPVQSYPGSDFPWSFIFIDDVSLTPCGATGVVQQHDNRVVVSPSLVTDELVLNTDDQRSLEFILFDAAGRPVVSERFSGRTTLDLRQLPAGIYLYEIADMGAVVSQGRIVKE